MPPVAEGIASYGPFSNLKPGPVSVESQDFAITVEIIGNGSAPCHPKFRWLQGPHCHGISEHGRPVDGR